jgi:hypothetical protein
MSLAPTHSLTLGLLRYGTHAADIGAVLALLPRGGSATVRLPVGVRFEAAPGDDAKLDLDGGDGASTILTGQVTEVRRAVDGIEVVIADAGGILGRLRPSASFERQPASGIARKLAGDAGVDLGTLDLDLDLPAYAAHPSRTAAEHIARLADWGDALALVDADGKLVIRKRPEGPADAALRYGREIVAIEHAAAEPRNPHRFVIGSGPAGNASAPNALRPAPGPLPEDADDGGPGVRRVAAPALRTPAAATKASTAASAAAARAGGRLDVRCFLLPKLRPGQVIEIQDLPDGLPGGAFLLTQVEHRLAHGLGMTRLSAERLAAPSGGLLGALLGAVGGLL